MFLRDSNKGFRYALYPNPVLPGLFNFTQQTCVDTTGQKCEYRILIEYSHFASDVNHLDLNQGCDTLLLHHPTSAKGNWPPYVYFGQSERKGIC